MPEEAARWQATFWQRITELSVSSLDEFPKQRSLACTFDGCSDLSAHTYRASYHFKLSQCRQITI